MKPKVPLLSILIPTKNRYSYLSNLILAISNFNSSNFEVVIQDNSDDNHEFIDFLKINDDSRIKYFYIKNSLSIIENSEFAIKNSEGEYLCFIGDDDGVLEEIVEFVEWMKSNSIESAVTNRPQYYWPDIVHKMHNFSGNLSYTNFSNTIKNIDSRKELMKCLNKGGGSLELMPRLYHGIVSRKSLDKLYTICSSYFPGPSPDMANAVALSVFIERHVYFDSPIIIAGAGFNSAGGAGARKSHIGKLEELPFLPKNTVNDWEITIPKIWTGQTIWAESAIKALRATNNERYIKFFNFNYFYASFFVFHFQLIKNNLKFVKNNGHLMFVAYYMLLITLVRCKFMLINVLSLKTKMFNKKAISNIKNIESCIKTLENILHLKDESAHIKKKDRK